MQSIEDLSRRAACKLSSAKFKEATQFSMQGIEDAFMALPITLKGYWGLPRGLAGKKRLERKRGCRGVGIYGRAISSMPCIEHWVAPCRGGEIFSPS
jgi:hypothetical protein